VVKLQNVQYNSEHFPDLIFRSFKPIKTVLLIFFNGKIVFTDFNEKKHIEPTLVNLEYLLNKHKLFILS